MTDIDPKLIQQLQAKLEAERAELEGELSKFAKPTGQPDEFETKFEDIGDEEDDNANEVEEYAGHLALEQNLEGQLKAISKALGRIQDGTYGFCSNCGEAIPTERLLAYPAADTCVRCRK